MEKVPKILLFGKNGQVGWELQRSLSVIGDIIALDSSSTEYCGDFTNLNALGDTVRQVKPDVIVNAAAYTAVDKAESEPEQTRTINALAPEVLAKQAELCEALFVHYSTDYVFDGTGDIAWKESDIANPLNIYGVTKLEGERLIANCNKRHLIFRTSWVYAARGGNFAKTMLRLANERDKLMVINDQIGTPTGADLLADVTSHAIRETIVDANLVGLYHLTATGSTSWYNYAKFVIEYAQQLGVETKLKVDLIEPVLTTAFLTPANRPKNSRLDCSLLCQQFGLKLPFWQKGVARMLDEIVSNGRF